MRSPLRLLALTGVLAIAVLAAWVIRHSFEMPVRDDGRAEPRESAADAAAAGDPEVVDRALRLAAIDSTRKAEWVSDIPDLDLASLTGATRETFLRIANGRHCTCGCGFTLAGCRRFDSECEVSGPRAQALFDSVRTGRITRAEGYAAAPAAR